jgi:hypothetical protein
MLGQQDRRTSRLPTTKPIFDCSIVSVERAKTSNWSRFGVQQQHITVRWPKLQVQPSRSSIYPCSCCLRPAFCTMEDGIRRNRKRMKFRHRQCPRRYDKTHQSYCYTSTWKKGISYSNTMDAGRSNSEIPKF